MEQVNTTQPLLPQRDRNQIAAQIELERSQNQYTTLYFLLSRVGIDDIVLNSFIVNNLSVLAPTDETFSRVNQAFLREMLLPQNINLLRAILLFHVIPNTASILNDFSPNSTNPGSQEIVQELLLDSQNGPQLENIPQTLSQIQASETQGAGDIGQFISQGLTSGNVRYPLFIPINTLLIPPVLAQAVDEIVRRVNSRVKRITRPPYWGRPKSLLNNL